MDGEILDHVINQRIQLGYFPVEKLTPASRERCQISLEKEAKHGMTVFAASSELFSQVFLRFSNIANGIDSLHRPELFKKNVNCYINSLVSENDLSPSRMQEAIDLVPAITPLDKALWMGAHTYFLFRWSNNEALDCDASSLMFAWINLLRIVQTEEIRSGRTIDVSKVSAKTKILDVILGSFESNSALKYTRLLTSEEQSGLNTLFDNRQLLQSQIDKERKLGKEIAQKTEKEWDLFLKVIYDIAEKEASVIRQIISNCSKKEKLRAIYDYNSIITQITNGHYDIGTDEINLCAIFGAVVERIQKAPASTCVSIDGKEPFRLHPEILMLAMNPLTFNYLLISFHQLRIEANKETAKQFLSTALACIKRNLGGEEHKWISLDEMIQDFYDTVTGFYKENKAVIEQLSFDSLQTDTVAATGSSIDVLTGSNRLRSLLIKQAKEFNAREFSEGDLKKPFHESFDAIDSGRIAEQFATEEKKNELEEKKDFAQRIVRSLNIIYLFCGALRIMLSSKHSTIKIKRIDVAEHIEQELESIESRLVYLFYGNIDDPKRSMATYRRVSGINSSKLSIQEADEEQFRISTVADNFMDALERLANGIEGKNIDELISLKNDVRGKINSSPECGLKEQIIVRFDEISGKICDGLINHCKTQEDNYLEIKNSILSSLEASNNLLPPLTLDSLTTAEMLYGRYAREDFSKEGFDYSCISALYYQAFENAYNELIWYPYVDVLDNLIINDEPYNVIITRCMINRTNPEKAADGYLPADSLSYYFSTEKRMANGHCMYKSFAYLMSYVNEEDRNGKRRVPKFSDFFAELSGYQNKVGMFQDRKFMKLLQSFTDKIFDSVDNRNNASHGGMRISKKQCDEDKRTVLYELNAVRSNTIGLIQQLLYLLNWRSA